MNKIEHIELTSEEIKNHFGFECKTQNEIIIVSSFIGEYKYNCFMFKHGYMSEFYRFCQLYSRQLCKFGVENKNKEIHY